MAALVDIPVRQPPPNVSLVGPDGQPLEVLTRQAAVEKLVDGVSPELQQVLARGAAFHHGGLPPEQELPAKRARVPVNAKGLTCRARMAGWLTVISLQGGCSPES